MQKRKVRSLKHPSLWLLAAAIGLSAGVAAAQPPDPTNSDTSGNTAGGGLALYDLTSGGRNTAFGYYALKSNTTGSYNTASGDYALFANNGSYNTASGHYALGFNTTGSYNTGSGFQALYLNTTGTYNTAAGAFALNSNTTGDSNTASGDGALYANTTGSYNTATGASALDHNTTGAHNTASGYEALYLNTTGSNNTAAGNGALYANTKGSNNVALGYQALVASVTGTSNVAVGYGTLGALTAGNSNIALGVNAGKLTKTGSNNIYIGHNGINGSESNVMRLGKAQTQTFIAGIAGVPVSGATVVVKANGQLGVVASSARYKQDIRALGDVAEKLAQLQPVTYRYKAEPEATHYGLIAEDVDKVMPELVVRDDENRPETVQYQELIPLLLQQWKAQRELIAQQQAELAELRRMLATRLAGLDRNR